VFHTVGVKFDSTKPLIWFVPLKLQGSKRILSGVWIDGSHVFGLMAFARC
jgi:hypothetical protein